MAEKRHWSKAQSQSESDGSEALVQDSSAQETSGLESKDLREVEELSTETVAEQYRERIFRYILRLVRDPSEADDLTQETFLRVHRKLSSLQNPATLTTWLYRIATNVCYDRFRQASYRHRADPQPALPGDEENDKELEDAGVPSLDQIIDRADMGNCIREFIERLSDSYRTVLLLHDLNGMTNPEIAQAMNCSLATVKIRLHRARRRLKDALSAGCSFSYDDRGVLVCERRLPGN